MSAYACKDDNMSNYNHLLKRKLLVIDLSMYLVNLMRNRVRFQISENAHPLKIEVKGHHQKFM